MFFLYTLSIEYIRHYTATFHIFLRSLAGPRSSLQYTTYSTLINTRARRREHSTHSPMSARTSAPAEIQIFDRQPLGQSSPCCTHHRTPGERDLGSLIKH